MKKILYFLVVFFSFFSLMTISACGKDSDTENEKTQENDIVITKEDLEAVTFESKTFDYTGESHSIYVSGAPKDVEITYKNNEKTYPGKYRVEATMTYNDITVKKTAYLEIKRVEPTLTADEEQTVVWYGGNVLPSYNLNNEEQQISYKVYVNDEEVDLSSIYKPGTYKVEVIANQSKIYSEKSVFVTLNVVDSNYGVSFTNQTALFTGQQIELSAEISRELPNGYTIKYTDNKGIDVGNYYATAEVLNEKNEVVETHKATLSIVYPNNEAFNEYLDEFFFLYLEDDLLSINIFCENPSDWGFDIEDYDAVWYTYEPSTVEDLQQGKEDFQELYNELKEFEEAQLSPLQLVAYNKVESFILENLELYDIEDIEYVRMNYVDQFGGYIADFATYMEAYSYRSEADVVDVIDFIKSTETAFPSYLEFVKARWEHGYALSNFTIEKMQEFLSEILEQGKDYYLADVICEKINEVDSTILSSTLKAKYCDEVVEAMDTQYLNGVKALHDGLSAYLDKLPEDKIGYWASYENGESLFKQELKSLLGLNDFSYETYIAQLEAELKRTNKITTDAQRHMINTIGIYSNEEYAAAFTKYVIMNGTPQEMMEYLKEFAPTIVPNLKSEPEINFKNMDEASAKVSNAVAYYMKSALDNTGAENITLNPLKLEDPNDVLGTLAHEGYPGHLYSYIFSKEIGQHDLSTIMTSTAHAEGWATYVQLALYEYAMKTTTDTKLQSVLGCLYANQLSGYLIYALFDAYIHCEGWGIAEIAKWLKVNYGYDEEESIEAGTEIYNLLIETPVSYAAYAYGEYMFVKLHDQAKQILGNYYDEVEFNTMLLSKGWTSLGELQNTYDEYITIKCHQYGIVL